MFEELRIISWPDPRLLKKSVSVSAFDEKLAALAQRMLELMREFRGVGLAAPQVGQNVQLFVMNPTGKPGDDRVYVNPELEDPDGQEEAEEGCLSLPGINVNIVRAKSITLRANDLHGDKLELHEAGYLARIWQHEFDHLNGTLLTDRMGPVAKLSNRKTLSELKAKYQTQHPALEVAGKRSRR